MLVVGGGGVVGALPTCPEAVCLPHLAAGVCTLCVTARAAVSSSSSSSAPSTSNPNAKWGVDFKLGQSRELRFTGVRGSFVIHYAWMIKVICINAECGTSDANYAQNSCRFTHPKPMLKVKMKKTINKIYIIVLVFICSPLISI